MTDEKKKSEFVVLDPNEFRCLDWAPHESMILESRHLRVVRGSTDYDGQPLDDVDVFLEPVQGTGKTAFHEKTVDGLFAFQGIPEGAYRLRTCAHGWNEVIIDVEVSEQGKNVNIAIPMTLS